MGGTRRDDTGFSQPPESCISQPKLVSTEQYFSEKSFWQNQNLSTIPESITVSLKPKTVYAFDMYVNLLF